MRTSAERINYVQSHYLLRLDGASWEAVALGLNGEVVSRIVGADRSHVCRVARAQWGHFNFEDESAAFDAIFRSR